MKSPFIDKNDSTCVVGRKVFALESVTESEQQPGSCCTCIDIKSELYQQYIKKNFTPKKEALVVEGILHHVIQITDFYF